MAKQSQSWNGPPPCTGSRRASSPLGSYEHLYRHEIESETYRQLFNQIRPHEGIGMKRPLDVHLQAIDHEKILKSTEPETLPLP